MARRLGRGQRIRRAPSDSVYGSNTSARHGLHGRPGSAALGQIAPLCAARAGRLCVTPAELHRACGVPQRTPAQAAVPKRSPTTAEAAQARLQARTRRAALDVLRR